MAMHVICTELITSLSHTMGGYVKSKKCKNQIKFYKLILRRTTDESAIAYVSLTGLCKYTSEHDAQIVKIYAIYDAQIVKIYAIHEDGEIKEARGFYPFKVQIGKNLITVLI